MSDKIKVFSLILVGSILLNCWFVYRSILRRSSPEKPRIAFVGDSIIEAFPTKNIHGYEVVNFGVGGYMSYDVLRMISKAARTRPLKIYIAVGVNDIKAGITTDSAISNIRESINRVRFYDQDIEIYCSSILPLFGKWQKNRGAALVFNRKLDSLSKEMHFTFIDQDTAMDNEVYYGDGLHPNQKGYIQLAKNIEHGLNLNSSK